MQGALVQYLVRKLRSQKLYSQEKLKKNNISQEPHTNIKKKKRSKIKRILHCKGNENGYFRTKGNTE